MKLCNNNSQTSFKGVNLTVPKQIEKSAPEVEKFIKALKDTPDVKLLESVKDNSRIFDISISGQPHMAPYSWHVTGSGANSEKEYGIKSFINMLLKFKDFNVNVDQHTVEDALRVWAKFLIII